MHFYNCSSLQREPKHCEETIFDFSDSVSDVNNFDLFVCRRDETKTCFSDRSEECSNDCTSPFYQWASQSGYSLSPTNPTAVSRNSLTFLAFMCCCISIGECYIRMGHSSRMDQYLATIPPTPMPHVDPTHSGNVTALAEQTAMLNCRVHNIRNNTVSWIRHRDIHLLTVGKYTYTSDQRFRALHEDDSDDWLLKINYVQTRDSGIYECQVSTTPPMSHFIKLSVVKPLTHILGGPDIHINKGSTINLTCIVQFAPEPPKYINWHHSNKIISYDSERGGVTVIIEKGDITTSFLLIQAATDTDSGRYDCHPSNSAAGNITVHVLNAGEHPEAMHFGGQSTNAPFTFGHCLFLLIVTSILQRFIL